MNWTAIESVATVASVLATAAMTWMTYRAIRQTRDIHKDDYRPALAFAPDGVVDRDFRSDLLRIERDTGDATNGYALRVVLKNIGKGPALNVRCTLEFLGVEKYGVATELAPVGAHERLDFGDQPLWIKFTPNISFNDTDFHYGPRTAWKIFLEYEDVFGQCFHTIHVKNPQEPWTAIGRGPAPKGRKV